jgi:DNA-binding beta-propeller fold protein YncE
MIHVHHRRQLLLIVLLASVLAIISTVTGSFSSPNKNRKPELHKYLYVAVPGVRNYLEYGGHGIVVFDINEGHRFVKRIPTAGLDKEGKPSNVKGICVSTAYNCIYVSTLEALQCLDIRSEKILWEKTFEGGCDRMAISPNGKVIYLPTLEQDHWNVVDAKTGNLIKQIFTNPGAHNTIFGGDGSKVYLAGLHTPSLGVADAHTHAMIKQVGPFAAAVRPFTINGKQSLCFVNVNELLGFEIGDLLTGKKLYHVEVEGFKTGPVKRHGCPSHGIGFTPDEKELWLCDSYNQKIHVYDAATMPPKYKLNISLKDQPGWITFSLDGKYGYPSTGEVIDVKTHRILTSLKDEHGTDVQSEKMVEVHLQDGKVVRAGDQFGIGRKN